MDNKIKTAINSEIGELEAVILHTPGPEVENMTPGNAERALYSDILNLTVAREEYAQLEGVLKKLTKTFQVKDLLDQTLRNSEVRAELIEQICSNDDNEETRNFLLEKPVEELRNLLIEGVVMQKNTLSKYLSKERFSLPPLHNFFFTRDSATPVFNSVIINNMANKVRERESIIMGAIFNSDCSFSTSTYNSMISQPDISIEGGDILIVRDDIIIVGNGARTTTKGIDFIISMLCNDVRKKMHVIVQELPHLPESFIHLDMVFTLLDTDSCLIYEPVILKPNKFQTVTITIENGKVSSIKDEKNILDALYKLGMEMKPVYCGGRSDVWIQEREQWHSGANVFAVAPGKIIGYGRNTYTLDDLSKNGYQIVQARDIINNNIDPSQYNRLLIAIEGSELARGGGGARCMTMPVRRKEVDWTR